MSEPARIPPPPLGNESPDPAADPVRPRIVIPPDLWSTPPNPSPSPTPAVVPAESRRKPVPPLPFLATAPELPQIGAEPLPEGDWFLEVEGGRTYELQQPDVVIGREPEADGAQAVFLHSPDRTVSKTHARLTWRDDEWWVEDLNSLNGTRVISDDDGRERLLRAGESVRVEEWIDLGNVRLRLGRRASLG